MNGFYRYGRYNEKEYAKKVQLELKEKGNRTRLTKDLCDKWVVWINIEDFNASKLVEGVSND